MKKLHLRVKGAVHGVGFRAFTVHEAEKRALSGWVRNRSDDTVEITALGATSPLEEFFESIKTGPPHSVVAEVEDTWEEISNQEKPTQKFEILPTK